MVSLGLFQGSYVMYLTIKLRVSSVEMIFDNEVNDYQSFSLVADVSNKFSTWESSIFCHK